MAGADFTKRFLELREEIRRLKTSHIKSMSGVKTTAKRISVTFTLSAPENTGYATLSVNTEEPNQLSTCSLVGVSDVEERDFFVNRRLGTDTNFKFALGVLGNAQDWQDVSSGATKQLTYTFEVRCTSNFTVSVENN